MNPAVLLYVLVECHHRCEASSSSSACYPRAGGMYSSTEFFNVFDEKQEEFLMFFGVGD